MNIKSVDIFLSLSCTTHIALTMDLPALHKIPISFSFRHCASLPYSIASLTYLLKTAHFGISRNNLPYSNSPHSLSLIHTYLVLVVTAASHPPPALTLSPRFVNSLTVCISSHNLSSCSTAYPIFPSHFLHVKFLKNIGVTLFTPTHLP